LASLAETKELKQVAVYSEPALLIEALLQINKIILSGINNYAAVGTNQMVVVLGGTDCVAAANASSV